MSRARGSLPPALALLLVAAVLPVDRVSAPAWGARAGAKACRKSCKRPSAACLRSAKKERTVRTEACQSAPEGRRPCRAALATAFRRSKQSCRTLRKSCRACCKAGGANCAGEAAVFGGGFRVPDRSVLDTLPLPPGPNGAGFTWLGTADGTLVIDPSRRSPVSAAAECAAFVLACFRPGARNWAGCFEAAPPCPSDTPWLGDGAICCPSACAARYQALRQSGLDGPTAVTRAIWDEPSCIPGLVGRSPGEVP